MPEVLWRMRTALVIFPVASFVGCRNEGVEFGGGEGSAAVDRDVVQDGVLLG